MTTPTKETLLAELRRKKLNDLASELEEDTITFEDMIFAIYKHLHPPASISADDAMDVDQQLPSPEPKGERIGLNAPSLLEFLERQMVDPTKFHCVPRVLTEDHMMFPLSGRDAALQQAAECMKVIGKPISQTTRIHRKIPVCSGLSGLGKTRMLEEWKRIFDLANICKEARLGVLVLYHNGHMPHPVERKMSIEASFSWRLLHRCFIEGNGDVFRHWFTESLPVNGGELTLDLALQVIRQKCINLGMLKSNETLHLFLGVDEYQTIHEVGGKKKGNEELLQDLLNVLGDIMASPVAGVRIYPMFAGTDFSVISIVNSSKTESLRMPMYLLTQSDVETAISFIPNGDRLLLHAPVRRHLFYLGGVPRWVTEYILRLLKEIENIPPDDFLTIETIENAFKTIKNLYVVAWGRSLGAINFIKLVAYAIAGQEVDEEVAVINDMSWSRVRDSSLCLLNDDHEVLIPYAILHRISEYPLHLFQDNAICCLILCIQGLIEKVDELIYDKAPWQLWEVFGAYYHALRINSLIIVDRSVVKVKQLFKGAIVNGCEDEVELRPMLVMETEDKFSTDMSSPMIGRKGNYNERHDWLKEGLVVINGEGGEGVDVFYVLQKKSSDGYVVFTDQRKRVGGNNLGQIGVSNLLQKASIMPRILAANSTLVACLFSCVIYANVSAVDLAKNSIVVAYGQNQRYHGTLWTHPASSPFVKINSDPISYIQMVFSGKDKRKLADAVLVQRETKTFTAIDELEIFVNEQKLDASLIPEYDKRVSFC